MNPVDEFDKWLIEVVVSATRVRDVIASHEPHTSDDATALLSQLEEDLDGLKATVRNITHEYWH